MQILEYEDDNHLHVCLSCDAEFKVQMLNNSDMELVEPQFCPFCGDPLAEDDEDDIMFDIGDPDDEDFN